MQLQRRMAMLAPQNRLWCERVTARIAMVWLLRAANGVEAMDHLEICILVLLGAVLSQNLVWILDI